jgi:hypothetical protein
MRKIAAIARGHGKRVKSTRRRLSPLNADNRSDLQCGHSESRSKPRSGPRRKSNVELSSHYALFTLEPNGDVLQRNAMNSRRPGFARADRYCQRQRSCRNYFICAQRRVVRIVGKQFNKTAQREKRAVEHIRLL